MLFISLNAQVEKLNKSFLVEDYIVQYKDALSKKDTSSALNSILDAIESLENLTDKQTKYFTYDTLAAMLHEIRKYEKAVELHKEAGDYFLSVNDLNEVASIYWQLSLNYSKLFDYPTANIYSKKIIALKDKIDNPKLISSAFNDLGLIFWKIGQLDSAVYFINKSITISKSKEDSVSLAKRYNNLGVIYWRKGDIENAYRFYSESLFIREAINDKKASARVLNNLSLIFQRLKYYDLAKTYIGRALDISEDLSDPIGKSYAMRRFGDLLIELQEYEEAEKFLRESTNLLYDLDDQISLVQVYNLLGNIYEETDRISAAVANYKSAVKTSKKINDNFSLALAYYNLGSLYLKSKQLDSSSYYLKMSIRLSEPYGYRMIKRDAYKELADYFEITKNLFQEKFYLRKYISINDSLLNESLVSSISEVNTRNMIKTSEERRLLLQKENEIQKKEIEYQTRLITAITFMLTIILGLLFYSFYLYNKKKKLVKIIEDQNLALQQANNTKDKLFSIIAHDLKGPFTSILGFAHLIHEETENNTNKVIHEYSSSLIKNLNRLVELINNLLNWSLIQRQKISVNKEKIDFCELVDNVLREIELNAQLKRIVFKRAESKKIFICGDRDMLSSAVRNILSNSIKYSKKDGVIEIKCMEDERFLKASFTDNGIGISKDKIDSILYNTTTESTLGTGNEKGTGIGLSICKEFIEEHGGKLEIKSDGSTYSEFIINLPLNS